MMNKRVMPLRASILTLAVSVGISVGALVGPGLVSASPYPPEPQPPYPETPVDVLPPLPNQGGVQGAGELPRTGNSDVARTLTIATATLMAGLGITGVAMASRRRTGTTNDPR